MEPRRGHRPLGHIMRAKRERINAAPVLPFDLTAPQVSFQPCRRLVAFLCWFGKQPQHQVGEQFRDTRDPLRWRHRLPGQVAVHQAHRVVGSEWQYASQHLIKGDAECIKVAAGIDRPVHAPGLLGGHIGQRAGNLLGRTWRVALACQARGNAEAGEPGRPKVIVHQDVGWLEVLVNQASPMELAQGRGDADGQAQEAAQLHGRTQQPG